MTNLDNIFKLINEIKKVKVEIVDVPFNTDFMETKQSKSQVCINGKCKNSEKKKIKVGV